MGMSHEELQELLGAYALDAVEPEDATRVEQHLEVCPRCRDELRCHREVVGVLAYAGQEAPPGLWDRVVAGVHQEDEDAGAPPQLRPLPGAGAGPTIPGWTPWITRRAVRTSGRAAGPGRASGRAAGPGRASGRAPGFRLASFVAAAALVVVGLLAAQVVALEHRTDHLGAEISAMAYQPSMATVQAALSVPGAKKVVLRPVSGGTSSLDAVILPGGTGYLYGVHLAPLDPEHTYQLWGIVGSERISYGLIGSHPAPVTAFQVAQGVQALAVTEEVAGGVVSTANAPVVVGMVST
jgi:hypothetical protein